MRYLSRAEVLIAQYARAARKANNGWTPLHKAARTARALRDGRVTVDAHRTIRPVTPVAEVAEVAAWC